MILQDIKKLFSKRVTAEIIGSDEVVCGFLTVLPIDSYFYKKGCYVSEKDKPFYHLVNPETINLIDN